MTIEELLLALDYSGDQGNLLSSEAAKAIRKLLVDILTLENYAEEF